mmetsp:Transcript_149684/g.264232  ORF Transcript_149684/g.264232 Transcript_149684/m.264232 type:complete len:158 (-) Transcript_149684:107-580(-)
MSNSQPPSTMAGTNLRDTPGCREFFAPWILDMGMQVVAHSEESVTLLLPNDGKLRHGGGVMCGQAMMAAADTATVITHALANLNDLNGTIQFNMVFLKPVAKFDLLVESRIVKASKTQVYSIVDFIRADKPGDIVAQATTIFARKANNGATIQQSKL